VRVVVSARHPGQLEEVDQEVLVAYNGILIM
jgi:hypothetical protein